YFITEGRQYFLEQIDIDGNTSLSDDEILVILDHKLDKPYNPIKIREGIKLLKTEYANNGKPLASIQDSVDVNSGIHLFIHITENPTMKIGAVKIMNNKLVKNRPIEREILLKPGDLYSQKKIDLSKKHIFETGLFSSVNVRFSEVDTAKHILNLLVDVRELDMRYLGGSVGFGQEKGIAEGSDEYTSLSLNGEWLHRNIAGRGSRLSLNTGLSVNFTNIFSRPATSASITYLEPWLLGFRSSTSFQLFYENELVAGKPQTKYGEKTALIYQPDRRFFASVGFVIQKVTWTDETGDNERAFTFQVRRDYRDNFLFPTKGTVFTFDGKIVGTILGGTQDYYWSETSFSQYFPLWRKIVFAYRGKLGYQKSLGEKSTPNYAKFYLGGGSSLRGWRYNDFVTDGGNVKVLTNAEIRFPLIWILGGEVFIDGGNLASDIPALLNTTYRWDTGFGLTIATPLGPIRIDIAKILGKKDQPYQWQFSIPYAF
ncbi:MAG: BamA/TamA family outer membrane protein, partial [Candidatus Marinimicrobia bacterium]|nr:BamA/TamA family outer membrane protein [Candidatus Neomarinimicrobiota bacterium]